MTERIIFPVASTVVRPAMSVQEALCPLLLSLGGNLKHFGRRFHERSQASHDHRAQESIQRPAQLHHALLRAIHSPRVQAKQAVCLTPLQHDGSNERVS